MSLNPGTFPFNSYRFGAGRLDPSTSNLGMGYGTYNPNMNGFLAGGAVGLAVGIGGFLACNAALDLETLGAGALLCLGLVGAVAAGAGQATANVVEGTPWNEGMP